MIHIINQLMFCMVCDFKCSWREKYDISHQVVVLKLITAICEETNTRKQMIANILFNKIKYVLLFNRALFPHRFRIRFKYLLKWYL